MTSHILLALSCAALLIVIALQDYLYPPLRNETISSGLTGPYHVLLDAAYVPLSATLIWACFGHLLMEVFAIIAGLSLLLVAATNTAWRYFNALTDGQHALWHSRFTLVVFVSAFALQIAGDHGGLWALSALNIAVPAGAYVYLQERKEPIAGTVIAASPAAEKLYVFGLCFWLIVWAL